MPEADTIDRVTSRKVQVASLPPADSGRVLARLPARLMKALGLKDGDVIEIVGVFDVVEEEDSWGREGREYPVRFWTGRDGSTKRS